MLKKISKLVMTTMGFALLISSCTKSTEQDPLLTYQLDVTGTMFAGSTFISNKPSVANDALTTVPLFSTDGTNFSQFTHLSVGKKYQVKLLNLESGHTLDDTNIYVLDWSKSSPQPTDVHANVAQFTYQGTNTINVKVDSCLYSANNWLGAWIGEEVGGSIDANNVIADPNTPNTFIMDNWFGDATTCSFVLTPVYSSDTKVSHHVVTIPSQVTPEGGTASGTGTYDPCRQTMTMNCKYVIPGVGTFTWVYNWHR